LLLWLRIEEYNSAAAGLKKLNPASANRHRQQTTVALLDNTSMISAYDAAMLNLQRHLCSNPPMSFLSARPVAIKLAMPTTGVNAALGMGRAAPI